MVKLAVSLLPALVPHFGYFEANPKHLISSSVNISERIFKKM